MVANLTQILNFKVNFHQEFELFSKNKIYANNGGHFKIVSIIKTRCTRGDARSFFCTHKTYLYAQNKISYEYIQILF